MSEETQPLEVSADALTDILEGKSAPAPEEPAPKPAEEAPKSEEPAAEEPKGEEGQGDEPEPTGEPPAPQDDDKGQRVPLKALEDERRKRQELENRLAQLEQKEAPKAPDPIDDPEGYQTYQDQKALNDRIELSMEFARELHEDFDDVYQVFIDEAATNPVLAQQAIQAKAPALHCYREGKRLMQMREIGDPLEYANKQVEAATSELKAEIAELRKQLETNQKRESIPQSLAGQRSVGQRGGPTEPTDASLSDLLPG